MFLKSSFLVLFMLLTIIVNAQQLETKNPNSLEVGFNVAGDEALYYGAYSKFSMPLSQQKHHFTVGFSLTAVFDFKGESTSEAYLKNDIDMRILPSVHIGYALNFNKFQLNFDVPIGASIAVTKGTLVNDKIGFERSYSNSEVFFNYGLEFSPKYRINDKNLIGLRAFMPLINDKVQSAGYIVGIGWTTNFID